MAGAVNGAAILVAALRDPASTAALDAASWNALIAAARAELLIGTLAYRLDGLDLPPVVARLLGDARHSAEQGRVAALWEAEMARRALAPLDVPIVLLKGTAFVAAGLRAGQGRHIGDLDILVPRDRLDAVEGALLAAGWEWVKPDPYDDAYYRRWMHELPALIHQERDRMIDVHHTILPLTAKITPDAEALLAGRVPLEDGLFTLSPQDMLCHAAAHCMADGDLEGGLRNLWDIHCLLDEFGFAGLVERARHHGLSGAMVRAARLARDLYGTELPPEWDRRSAADAIFMRRLLARDGWGRRARPATRQAFYIRSHMLRMPIGLLTRHLWTKWRKGYRPVG